MRFLDFTIVPYIKEKKAGDGNGPKRIPRESEPGHRK